jgi:drug/metabolite transporter (DMT)-like permease
MKVAGIILLVVGLVALVYGGFQYTTQKKVVDMGPVQIAKTEHHSIPLPPLLGIGCIVAGGLVLAVGSRGAH